MNRLFYKAAGAVLAPFRYAEREVAHLKDVAKEDMQAFVAKAIKFAIMGVAGLFCLMFLSTMVAWWINDSMDSQFIGHGIVAGFYLIVAGVVYAIRDSGNKKKHESSNDRAVTTSDAQVRSKGYQYKATQRSSVGS